MLKHRDRDTYIKWLLYFLLLVAFFLIQTTYGLAPRIRGAAINVLPFFLAALAVFEEPMTAAVFSAITGLMWDGATAGPDGVYLAWYTVSTVIASQLVRRYLRRTITACLLIGGLTLVAQQVTVYILYYLLIRGLSLSLAFPLMLTELAVSLAAAPIAYFSVRAIWRRFTPERERS